MLGALHLTFPSEAARILWATSSDIPIWSCSMGGGGGGGGSGETI